MARRRDRRPPVERGLALDDVPSGCSGSGASRSRSTSSTARRRCPASPTSTSARRRSRSASAPRSATDDTSRDPSRPRPLPRQGRRRRGGCSRELLGKEAGYCRGKGGSMHIADHEQRQPRRERDRRRLGRDRHRRGVLGQAARHRPGRGLLLRRGRARPGAPLRGDEHGRALDAAGDLRLREQPLQRVHALRRGHGGRSIPARPRRSGSPPRRSTGRTCSPCTRRAAAPSSGRAPARGRRSCSATTYRYHGHHVGDVDRAYYRAKDEEERWAAGARSDRAARPRTARRRARAEARSTRSTARSRRRSRPPSSSRSTAPYPGSRAR